MKLQKKTILNQQFIILISVAGRDQAFCRVSDTINGLFTIRALDKSKLVLGQFNSDIVCHLYFISFTFGYFELILL